MCPKHSKLYFWPGNGYVITLIDKKDKDRTLLGNWRPISLLNMDVKLLSKVLAYRIKNILPNNYNS